MRILDNRRRRRRTLRAIARTAGVGFAVAACGDGIATPDAPPLFDASDAGLVRVLVTPSTMPPSGQALVYFQNRDSTIALATRTDAAGAASAYMRPNGFVTVVETVNGSTSLFSYANVSPGDVLYVRPRIESQVARLTVHSPEGPANATYELRTACSNEFASSATTQIILLGCGTATDIMVLPDDSRYAYANDVAIDTQTQVTMPPYREFENATLRVTSVDDDAAFWLDHGFVIGARVFSAGKEIVQPIEGGVELTRPLPLPNGGVTRWVIQPMRDDWPHVTTWQPAEEAIRVDYTATTLTAPTTLAAFDPSSLTIRWSESVSGIRANASFVELQWGEGRPFRWQVVALRGEDPEVALPTLPSTSLVPPPNVLVKLFRLHTTGYASGSLNALLGTWHPSTSPEWPIVGNEGQAVWSRVSTD